jgi:hypothetical protein
MCDIDPRVKLSEAAIQNFSRLNAHERLLALQTLTCLADAHDQGVVHTRYFSEVEWADSNIFCRWGIRVVYGIGASVLEIDWIDFDPPSPRGGGRLSPRLAIDPPHLEFETLPILLWKKVTRQSLAWLLAQWIEEREFRCLRGTCAEPALVTVEVEPAPEAVDERGNVYVIEGLFAMSTSNVARFQLSAPNAPGLQLDGDDALRSTIRSATIAAARWTAHDAATAIVSNSDASTRPYDNVACHTMSGRRNACGLYGTSLTLERDVGHLRISIELDLQPHQGFAKSTPPRRFGCSDNRYDLDDLDDLGDDIEVDCGRPWLHETGEADLPLVMCDRPPGISLCVQ